MMRYNVKQPLAVLCLVLAALLLLGGIPGSAFAHTQAPTTTPDPAEKVVQVKDVDELVAAVGPNVTVELLPGEYDLASAASYGKDTGNPYCRWDAVSETGFELNVFGVDGLFLRGAGMDETSIIAEDRYASVISFSGCRELRVFGLTAGHNPAPGHCLGGVLLFKNCSDAAVVSCGLFGCGTVGVWATNCSDLAVTHSRIYECSDNAVNVDGCRNVTVTDCEIDHNGWGNDTAASRLFGAYEGDGFTVSGCRIHDNVAGLLLGTSYTRNVLLVGSRVEYNNFVFALNLDGISATVDDCAFRRNEIGRWYVDPLYAIGYEKPSLPAHDGTGKELTEEDLAAMEIRPVRLTGTEEISLPKPLDVAPGEEVVVTTVDEFLAAIGPDRIITLDGENFFLGDATGYGVADGWYYHWEDCYDGFQLVITGVSGMTIRAAAKDPAATLFTTAPRYANVIRFMGCDNVTVSGLTVGHSEELGECAGGVLDFENCNQVNVERCRLYGCGTLGVYASYGRDLKLTDCEIYDCSMGGVVLYGVYGATFQNCRIHDVPSPALTLYDCYEVTWNGNAVPGNYYDVTGYGALVPVEIGG